MKYFCAVALLERRSLSLGIHPEHLGKVSARCMQEATVM